MRSTVRRAGGVTSATGTGCVPGGQPPSPLATTAVGADVAVVDPLAFVAVTRTRRVWPTSALTTTYVPADAPGMSVHAPPNRSQRRHWNEKVIVPGPVHVPGLAVSVCPSSGVPVTKGGFVLLGAAGAATAVGAEAAVPVPSALVASTTTRTVLPTSADVSV